MPHKVNPIDFENAEGNLRHRQRRSTSTSRAKLPVSRLQRDLTDSTVLRNVGVPVAHALLALAIAAQGAGQGDPQPRGAGAATWTNNWAVVAEGIQTVLRRAGLAPRPTRRSRPSRAPNAHITRRGDRRIHRPLDVLEEVKANSPSTPASYTGIDF